MSKPAIVCVDDQREVLAAVIKDLAPFEAHCDVIACESADEARGVLDDLDASGVKIALVISDHVMPGETGVELLGGLASDARFAAVPKLLLTGLATHEDTIAAINQAKIRAYIAKPWQPDSLQATVRGALTAFVLADGELNYRDFSGLLDQAMVLEYLHRTGGE